MYFKRTSQLNNQRYASFWLAIAFAVTTLFSPFAHASLGEAFELSGGLHSGSAALHLHDDDQGHNHHPTRSEKNSEQHSHDHNPADHSHEVPAVTVHFQSDLSAIPMNDYQSFFKDPFVQIAFNIDRPPRF